jgi:NAD(P)-dependent dehydrogenase (short-subunit alcohol dehydrogenase family)
MTQRNWFITGISSGFGRHLAEQLLERGDRVAGTVRHLNKVDDLKSRYGDQLWLTTLDVTDTQAIRQVIDRVFQDLSRIDILVNNAGYGLFGAAEELTDAQIEHQLATNVVGSIQVVRAALPHLRGQGGGRILQVSSMGGQMAMPCLSLYHASKWAIEGFFESLAQEIAPFNIQATLVEPGGARTNFGSSSAICGDPMKVYEETPAGALRKAIETNAFTPVGDPAKIARAMIACVEEKQAPKRLTLGSDAFALVHAALTERLAALEAQKNLALSTDFNA